MFPRLKAGNSLTPEQVQAMLAMMGQTQMAQPAVQQMAPQTPSVPVAVQPVVVQTPQMAPPATTQATPLGFDAPVFS